MTCPVCSTEHAQPARTVHDYCPVAQDVAGVDRAALTAYLDEAAAAPVVADTLTIGRRDAAVDAIIALGQHDAGLRYGGQLPEALIR